MEAHAVSSASSERGDTPPAPDEPTPKERPPRAPRADGRAIALSKGVLEDLFGPPGERGFSVRFWDGRRDPVPEGDSAFELVLRRPGALRRALLPPTHAAMGRAYVEGDLDIVGPIENATELERSVAIRLRGPRVLLRTVWRLLRLPADGSPATGGTATRGSSGLRHSRSRDASAVRSHYDVGNDFFRLFLDERMVYTCGYFPEGDEDLDTAQAAKLELICRKLRLRRGERFLDVGCGWGALVMHAAERYGVEALGITLSEPQAELARERIASRGLRDRCRIEVVDYRDLPTGTRFDKVASVGMVEHVGASQLPIYFREIRRVMSPGGLFLNHGIVSLRPPRSTWRGWMDRLLSSRTSFIQRFVFPDSELLSPSENLAPGEKAGLEARDVENLREHYARTLREWLHRLEDHRARAVELVGEPTYRVWRLYMAASARLFASAELGVMQTLWGRPREDGSLPIPSNRADIYRPPHPAGTRPTHER